MTTPVDLRVVLVSAPSLPVGQAIARVLVEERLAACASLVPGVISVYRWQGAVEESSEVLLVIKTTGERLTSVQERVVALHPYEVPEIVALPVDAVLPAYLAWAVTETSLPAGAPRSEG